MSKTYQIVIYNSISDEKKLQNYAKLSGPAVKKAGGKFLARGLPLVIKEYGKKTRTVLIEWNSLQDAMNCYNGLDYQKALEELDNSAEREFRYLEGINE
tara:strand:+ start:243 stop:539 length:297 start_codon:yes stop_codon:yes gene_type:complete